MNTIRALEREKGELAEELKEEAKLNDLQERSEGISDIKFLKSLHTGEIVCRKMKGGCFSQHEDFCKQTIIDAFATAESLYDALDCITDALGNETRRRVSAVALEAEQAHLNDYCIGTVDSSITY